MHKEQNKLNKREQGQKLITYYIPRNLLQNLTNKNNSIQPMESITPEDLSIFKFQPDNILMIHKHSKTLFQYFQTPILALKQRNLLHNHLLQASFLPTGILYKKGMTSLQAEITKRIHSHNKLHFEEQQIINTFIPVLNCLQYLHSKGVTHASLSPQNIIFTEEGDVLLRDWLLQIPNNKYYEVEKVHDRSMNDDIGALGLMMLETATLTELKSENKNLAAYESMLKKLAQRYSRGYILAVYVMIRKVQKFYPHLQKMLKNNESYIESSEQLLSIYRKIKGEKQFKPAISPTILNHSNFKYIDFISKTPITTKKVAKIEDVENKKSYVEETKKKNIERVSKIAEKNSNNETMKKPDMALKKMSNIKINNIQEQQKNYKKTSKEDILKFGSPLKRLKTVSKKKAF